MPNTIQGPASTVDQISERVDGLERRLSALERKLELSALPAPPSPVVSPQSTMAVAPAEGAASVDLFSAAVILGKAILGIAGAYLLRALAESAAVPRLIVLAAAVFYACFWMILAARAHPASRFAAAIYGITASLILAPLLWESTSYFRILSSPLASFVLVAFFVLTLFVSRSRKLQTLPAIASLVVAITAWALILQTREILPYAAALVAVVFITELFVSLGYPIASRVVPALAADLVIWILVARLTSTGLAEQYPGVASLATSVLCLVLFLIFAAGIGYRTFLEGKPTTVFEIVQSAIVLALLAAAAAALGRWAEISLAVLLALLSAANYWAAFSRFAGKAQRRNRIVSEVFAPALFVFAVFLIAPPVAVSYILSLASVISIVAYVRAGRLTLALHSSLYIALAAMLSSLPVYAGNAFGGAIPAAPDASFWIVALAALACYLVASRRPMSRGVRRLLRALPVVLVSAAVASLVVAAIVRLLLSRFEFDASRISVVRTAVVSLVALGLGFFASRWKRVELVWVAYSAVALGALKLFLEDLRFGSPTTLMISLLFYGLIFVFLPKLARQASQPV